MAGRRVVFLLSAAFVGGSLAGCGAGDSAASGDAARDVSADSPPDDFRNDGSTSENVGMLFVTADATLQTTTIGAPCAAASSLAAEPSETAVGHDIHLSAAGIDSDQQSSNVTLTWVATAAAGSLASSTGTSNVFHCATPGTATVAVTAAISDSGASCDKIGSLVVTLTCDAP